MTVREWKIETTKMIIDAINRLPRPEREAFVCKHYRGQDIEEIAETLHRSVDETKEILKKAELQLNQELNRKNGLLTRASYAFC